MNPYEELKNYLESSLASGRRLVDITDELVSSGWTTAQIDVVLQQINHLGQQQYASQTSQLQKNRPTKKKHTIKIYAAIVVAVLLVFSVAVYFMVFASSKPTDFVTFADPNFTMQVPEAWSGDAGYQPGANVIFYYSPEDANDENRDKAARLIVYVDSQKDRIDQQISDSSDANLEILIDKTFTENDTEYRYVELRGAPLETPDKAIRIASITATRGEISINADIIVSEKYWSLHAEYAETILKSIVPACSEKVEADPYRSSSTALLCGS